MTEAVIVATARTPIGRAFKGSLKDVRPDDLSEQVVRGLLEKLPGARPRDDRRPLLGLRRPQRRPRVEPGPRHRGARRHGPPAGRDREPVLRQLDPDHADGLPRDQGRRGRHLPRRRRRVRLAVHQLRRGRRQRRRGPEPPVRGCRGPQRRDGPHQRDVDRPARGRACCPTSTSRWARRPRTSRPRAGVSRQRQDEWGVTSQNRAEKAIADGFFAREILPVTLADGTRRLRATTARAPA